MQELSARQVPINDAFWSPRLKVNATNAIFHQLRQLGTTWRCIVIHGKTTDGKPLKFIPYFLWANRGESQMTVWVNCG